MDWLDLLAVQGTLKSLLQHHSFFFFFFFLGWVISYANEWENYANYFWEGVEISRI